ncbi:MAG: hypothetical protein Q9173_004836 [Seirophora scorigena]
MQQAAISFALTVPAIWSDSARKKTEDAATKAGMQQASPPHIYSEPECAAIYTLKDLDNVESLRVKDRILVCDAGGGTVDIITYEVLQISPLSIAEFSLTVSLRISLNDEWGPGTIRYPPCSDSKQSKASRQPKWLSGMNAEQQGFYVNLPGVGDIQDAGVRSGNFHLSREEMRGLFEPVIDRIINLISSQIKAVSIVNSILLVGGFAESEYLYRRLLAWNGGTLIRILQPREASTAIVRGAVIKAMEKAGFSKTEITRRARRWYRVTVNESFVEGKHRAEDRCVNVDTGQALAKDQIRWFIKKDQIMSDEETFRYNFHRDFRHTAASGRITSLSCASDSPPSRLEPPARGRAPLHHHLEPHAPGQEGASRCCIGQRAAAMGCFLRCSSFFPGSSSCCCCCCCCRTAHYALCFMARNNNLTFALEFRGQRYRLANVLFE